MILRHLVMHGGIGPRASVGGVAFHNGGAVKGLHQLSDQIRAQVIASRLTGGQLDRDISGWGSPQRFIDRDQSLRADIRRHIDDGIR